MRMHACVHAYTRVCVCVCGYVRAFILHICCLKLIVWRLECCALVRQRMHILHTHSMYTIVQYTHIIRAYMRVYINIYTRHRHIHVGVYK